MSKAAKSFASGGNLPAHVKRIYSGSPPAELRAVAKAFVDLQALRHEADYDFVSQFTREQVRDIIALAQSAFDNWRAARANPDHRDAVELFLAAMLLWERWKK